LARDKNERKGTPLKQKKVSDLAAKLQKSQMAVVADYRGMKMVEIADLRGQLRKIDTEFHVVKNTLVRIAAAGSAYSALEPVLTGTSAIAFVFGDVQVSAKLLTDAARTSKFLKIKAALLQGQLVPAEQLTAVANLPPRPVLQAQFLGALQGPSASLVGVLSSPMQGLLAVLQARAQQIEASQAA
jgi:large subunit ribosomal protein L10